MGKKIMKQIKKIITENIKTFVVFFLVLILCTYEFPYYIETPGGTLDIAKRIVVKDGYQAQGSFHLAYVSELKATIPTLIISKFKKDWDIIKQSDVVMDQENASDAYLRDRLLLEEASQNAILVAYQKAKRKVEILNQKLYITYIDSISKTNLKVGDEIISVNGSSVTTKKALNSIIQAHSIGDTLDIVVIRNHKEIKTTAEIIEYEKQNIIGIMIYEKLELETDPSIELKFKSSESGPSGGLMMTLSIYNQLIKQDITKGKKIVGTGTIDCDGNVGEIAGIKYKLKGAEANADLFFVPNGKNYEEAMRLKQDLDYEIEIVGIDTFDEALEYLDKYIE